MAATTSRRLAGRGPRRRQLSAPHSLARTDQVSDLPRGQTSRGERSAGTRGRRAAADRTRPKVELLGEGRRHMTIKHLDCDHIDTIALCLDEDVYGANGDLSAAEIRRRLVENIHRETGHGYAKTGMIPVETVASLIQGVWQYEDRKYMDELSTANNQNPPPRACR